MTKVESAHQFAKRLGALLKSLRLARGMTQATVADLLGDGVAVETVSRFERGAVAPSLTWIARLSEIYGTSIDSVYAATLHEPPTDEPARAALLHLVRDLDPVRGEVLLAIAKAFVASTSRVAHAGDRKPVWLREQRSAE